MKKFTFLFAICSLFFIGTKTYCQTAGTLNFTATIPAQSSSYGNKHFVAIWIENNTGTFIKTKNRFGSSGNSNSHLCQWKAKSASNITDATTGATLNSYASAVTMATWNGTNVAGTLVADGTYKVWIETSWDDNGAGCGTQGTDRQWTSLSFVKGPAAVHLTGQVSLIFTMTLDWVPAAAAPVASFTSSSTTICPNGSVTFTDQSTNTPTSWAWTFAGGTPATSTLQNPVVTFATAGTHTVALTATNGGGSNTSTMSNYITVNPSVTPSVAISESANNICSGTSVTFTANPTNGGTPSYQWKLNGSNTGTNSNTYSNSSLANTDVVNCIMTTTATCPTSPTATSNSVTMTVNPTLVPTVSITPSATTVCPGTTVTITANPTNGGTPTYSWTVDGNIVGAGNTYSAVFTDGQAVVCNMTSTATCANPTLVTSNTFTTGVYTVAPVTISESTGTLNSNATSGNQWYDANGLIAGANNQAYTPSASGSYYSIVTDINGCTTTSNTINFTYVSVSNNNLNNNINIYPNPVNEFVVIESKNNNKLQIMLVDIQGRIINSIESISEKTIIKMADISKGIYFIKVISNNNTNIFKVVKQ